MNKQANQLGLV